LTVAAVVCGALVLWLAVGLSICEYDCRDEETNVYAMLVAFGFVAVAAAAAWWKSF
jgi:hypothetical protein